MKICDKVMVVYIPKMAKIGTNCHLSPIICRSSHLFALIDKVISFCTIFDFVNQNKPI